MQKLKDGRLVPWNWGSKFKDGSLRFETRQTQYCTLSILMFVCRVDIPIQALNLYFNGMAYLYFDSHTVINISFVVTHPVVSQVNPHVHLFFFAPRGSAGKPVAHRKGKGTSSTIFLGSP